VASLDVPVCSISLSCSFTFSTVKIVDVLSPLLLLVVPALPDDVDDAESPSFTPLNNVGLSFFDVSLFRSPIPAPPSIVGSSSFKAFSEPASVLPNN
jgi:hypothetical protein